MAESLTRLSLVLLVGGCGFRPSPARTNTTEPKPTARAGEARNVFITSSYGYNLFDGNCELFPFHVKDVQELKLRLYVITSGKRTNVQTVTYKWSKDMWPDWAEPLEYQAMVLIESGSSFGAKNKHRISLRVHQTLNTGSPWDSPPEEWEGAPVVIEGDDLTIGPSVIGMKVVAGVEGLFYQDQLSRGSTRWARGSSDIEEITKDSERRPDVTFIAATLKWK